MHTRWFVYAGCILSCWFIADDVVAQQPFPVATPAASAWGGQAVPVQVPFQPTLASPAAASAAQPIVTYGLPNGGTPTAISGQPTTDTIYTLQGPVALPPDSTTVTDAGQPWQPYAEGGLPQPGAPPYLPQTPLFPEAPATGLRPLPRPDDARDGLFQKARFTATWIPQLDDNGLGWTDLRSDITFGLPFFTRQTPILITPSYELHFLDSPTDLDLPPRLNDLSIEFSHFRRVTNNWIANIAIAPGYFADDHSFDSSDALRINGRALAIYDPTPEWTWVLGVTYLNGGWSKVVPVAGVIYEPNDDVKYEVVFPRPRIAWRLANSPVPGRDEFWFYVLGEFGNAIWAIEQSDGTPNMFASRDWRLSLGLERKILGGISHRVEIGYVFGREIKLASDGIERDIDDSFLLRLGVVY